MKYPPAGVIPFKPLLHTALHRGLARPVGMDSRLHRRLRGNGPGQAMAQPAPAVPFTGNHG